MKHYPAYEGVAREEISVDPVGDGMVEIMTTDIFGDSTVMWLTPDEAHTLASDLALVANEVEGI